jgi:ribosomal protein S18 acetylase RimI-like enzyme
VKLSFRRTVVPGDREVVRFLAESTGFFYPDEVDIAVELVDEFLLKGTESGYNFLFCEGEGGGVLGYSCYGKVSGTVESFDIFWMAVDSREQGKGIGRRILARTEDEIAAMGGARIYIETSSRDLYVRTRAIYIRAGYVQEARLKDYYAPGDSKVIYVKQIFKPVI